jgi:hypothetical protein
LKTHHTILAREVSLLLTQGKEEKGRKNIELLICIYESENCLISQVCAKNLSSISLEIYSYSFSLVIAQGLTKTHF